MLILLLVFAVCDSLKASNWDLSVEAKDFLFGGIWKNVSGPLNDPNNFDVLWSKTEATLQEEAYTCCEAYDKMRPQFNSLISAIGCDCVWLNDPEGLDEIARRAFPEDDVWQKLSMIYVMLSWTQRKATQKENELSIFNARKIPIEEKGCKNIYEYMLSGFMNADMLDIGKKCKFMQRKPSCLECIYALSQGYYLIPIPHDLEKDYRAGVRVFDETIGKYGRRGSNVEIALVAMSEKDYDATQYVMANMLRSLKSQWEISGPLDMLSIFFLISVDERFVVERFIVECNLRFYNWTINAKRVPSAEFCQHLQIIKGGFADDILGLQQALNEQALNFVKVMFSNLVKRGSVVEGDSSQWFRHQVEDHKAMFERLYRFMRTQEERVVCYTFTAKYVQCGCVCPLARPSFVFSRTIMGCRPFPPFPKGKPINDLPAYRKELVSRSMCFIPSKKHIRHMSLAEKNITIASLWATLYRVCGRGVTFHDIFIFNQDEQKRLLGKSKKYFDEIYNYPYFAFPTTKHLSILWEHAQHSVLEATGRSTLRAYGLSCSEGVKVAIFQEEPPFLTELACCVEGCSIIVEGKKEQSVREQYLAIQERETHLSSALITERARLLSLTKDVLFEIWEKSGLPFLSGAVLFWRGVNLQDIFVEDNKKFSELVLHKALFDFCSQDPPLVPVEKIDLIKKLDNAQDPEVESYSLRFYIVKMLEEYSNKQYM